MLLDHPRLENTAHFSFNIIQLLLFNIRLCNTSIFQWCPCSSPLVDKLKLHADAETLGTQNPESTEAGLDGLMAGCLSLMSACLPAHSPLSAGSLTIIVCSSYSGRHVPPHAALLGDAASIIHHN